MPPLPRIACVRIPRFPIGAVWRDTPRVALPIAVDAVPSRTIPGTTPSAPGDEHWDRRPIALAEGTRLRVATAAAAQWRVVPGMTIAAAKARCAALVVLPWNAPGIAREVTRASAAFLAASPQVTPAREAPGLWWIGAGGLGPMGERALASSLRAIARAWHPAARVAVADSCVAAQAATWSAHAQRTPLHVPPGEDAEYLARVPLALLPMDAELREALEALGLRTAGAFATLDPLEVERRWGSEGLGLWRLTHGQDDRRPTLARGETPRTVTHDLVMSADTMEPVLFIVRAALDRLARDLATDGLAATEVTITLTLDAATSALPHMGAGAPVVAHVVRLSRPTARDGPLFARCRALFDALPDRPEGPIREVAVGITGTAPAPAEQGDLLAASWRDPAAVEGMFERLRIGLGPGGVVRPVRHDSHAPERAAGWVGIEHPVPAPSADLRSSGGNGARTLPDGFASADVATAIPVASRLLGQPEEIAVTLDPQGTPRAVGWRGERHPLARADGPDLLSGEWWRSVPFARAYWRCASARDGRTFLIYRDATGWRLQGWHD